MKLSEILIGLGIALFVAVVLSPFASTHPDGLERVAEDKGFLSKAQEKPLTPEVIPDYEMPGIHSKTWATSAAGFVGTLLVYFGGYGTAKLLQAKRRATSSPGIQS
jgi:cobalt/nickel transport protein